MLLMKEGLVGANVQRSLAPSVVVAPGTAGSIRVLRGQLLRITALGDGAVASLFGFSLDEPGVWLSVHHTRVFSNSYLLGAGMRMVNNRRRPVMVLGKDSVRHHDLLLPGSTTSWLAERGYSGQQGCMESLARELARVGMSVPKLPDPINLFMHVGLARNGDIMPQDNLTRRGDSVTCRVVADTHFIVSACCTGIEGNDRPAPLGLSVAEDLMGFPSE